MPFTRRSALTLGLVLATQTLFAQPAYPEKPIKLIVPFPPGGGGDAVARLVGEALGKRLNQAMVVENKPGADQIVGTALLTQSPADGYTLMMTGDTMMAHAAYERQLPYNAFKDLTPVGRIAHVPTALLVNNRLGVKTMSELIALAKSKPGQLKAGHIGSGSPHFLGIKLIEQITGTKFLDVPYKGSGPTTLAVVSGEIDLVFASVNAALQLSEGGKATAIAVSSKRRVSSAPQLPTLAESGVPGFDIDTAFYIYAPGATPKALIARLDQELQAVVTDPAVRTRLTTMGFEVETATHEQSVAVHRQRFDLYRQLIKNLNLQWSD